MSDDTVAISKDDLDILLMGLRFSICHRDFSSTREAIKVEITTLEKLMKAAELTKAEKISER